MAATVDVVGGDDRRGARRRPVTQVPFSTSTKDRFQLFRN